MTKQDLIEGFRYDAWANGLWADALTAFDPRLTSPQALARMNQPKAWPEFPLDPFERASDVFVHILFSQRTWLQRIEPTITIRATDAQTAIEGLRAAWEPALTSRTLDERIEYLTYGGAPFTHTVEQIAGQVIGHGAYYRGQLRELAERIGMQDLPMTDYIAFVR
ncbi:hypothetical protein EON81_12085 [bacterium]|nr:MAG: hypothetical protein EON81_12085 [bacterium]